MQLMISKNTVLVKAFLPRQRQTACPKDLPVKGGVLCVFVAPGSILSGLGSGFGALLGGGHLYPS